MNHAKYYYFYYLMKQKLVKWGETRILRWVRGGGTGCYLSQYLQNKVTKIAVTPAARDRVRSDLLTGTRQDQDQVEE